MKASYYEVWFADGTIERASTLKAAEDAASKRLSE
jgi:hypothetical protein